MFLFSSDIPEEELPDWLSEDGLTSYSSVLTQFAFPKIQTDISLLLVNDESMREINRIRRDKDYTTDVLSFPLTFDQTSWELPPKGTFSFGPILSLGEIVISWETCRAQAKMIGHSDKEEFFRLFVHGFLHLLGYDHERGKKEETLMKEKEDLCLDLLLGP